MKKDFVFGAATSAYQIEGAAQKDGKGESIWDVFSHTEGKVFGNHNGDVACNHYDLFKDDISLMKEMGLDAYRFSVSWPRIFPNGKTDSLNKKGLEFYDLLVNALLDAGIEPYLTIYHWDLPQALEEQGGWLNRSVTDDFADFSSFIVEHFSDRVTCFSTFNEPQCIAYLGYKTGEHAPGRVLDDASVAKVYHHLALAHGKAVKRMREAAKKEIQIGFSSTGILYVPYSDSEDDITLARKKSFELSLDDRWGFYFNYFCDPAILGKYPEMDIILKEKDNDFILDGDMEVICQKLDFLGLNIYHGTEISSELGVIDNEGKPVTAMHWPITERVLNYGVKFLFERYNLPIYITENGLSCNDKIYLDGKVHDAERIDYLARYLSELKKAIDDGVDVRGYFQWSLMDNFEWAEGYKERFGLIYVDFKTQKRILKDSAFWYKDFINSNRK